MILRRAAPFFGAIAAVAATVGCSQGPPPPASPAVYAAPAPVYVAIGANETVGDGATRPLLGSWVQIFYRTALPADSVFVSVATRGATAADASRVQLPQAATLRPTIVTIWLGTQDLVRGVRPEVFAASFDQVVRGARDAGASKVLVASIGDLAARPEVVDRATTQFGTTAAVLAAIDAYASAIEDVAARHGATVVDVGAAETAEGSVPTGANPDDAAHARVAAAFAAAAA